MKYDLAKLQPHVVRRAPELWELCGFRPQHSTIMVKLVIWVGGLDSDWIP